MMGITSAFSSLDLKDSGKGPTKKHTVSLPNLLCDRPPIFDDDVNDQPIDFSKKYDESKKEIKYNFSLYAETDLDQPTDYSLRYAEDDTEGKMSTDSVKTYCTEGTPYETTFTFSSSTSMSDLREGKLEKKDTEKLKSSYSSGLMSPEKPVNYCDEGTPGYFSRVDSCSSLNIPKIEPKENGAKPKAVKFEPIVNYVEETPLMFSRSSSLGSLESIEGVHTDRSSVVSDFSRLTSGGISPSELPDSPSQTVPPSPKPQNAIVFAAPNENVFRDEVKSFKMESTPLEFSTATSLSSLMEESKIEEKVEEKSEVLDSVRTYCTEGTPAVLSHAASKSDLFESKPIEPLDEERSLSRQSSLSSLSDDALLQECILAGMPKREAAKTVEFSSNDEDDLKMLQDCINVGIGTTDKEGTPVTFTDDESDDEELLAECIRMGIAKITGQDDACSVSSTESASDDALLQECILAGMPKSPPPPKLTTSEKILLDQIISEGMKSCQITRKVPEPEQALRQCILTGMLKNQPKREPSSELTETERSLLQQCILAGMPKKAEPKHSCCVHCPRNKNKRKERSGNIVVVSSQIMTMRREITQASREWI